MLRLVHAVAMTRRERALELAKRIAQTEAELKRLRADFDALVPEEEGPATPKTRARIKPEGSAPEQMLAILATKPRKTFKVSELLKALPHLDKRLVRGTAARLSRNDDGRILKRGRGRYSINPNSEFVAQVNRELEKQMKEVMSE